MSEPAAVDEAAALFEDLVIAADAAYGYAGPDSSVPRGPGSNITFKLPGVFWLNYFGPAFLTTHPGLSAASGARTVPTGGVLIRTTQTPWPPAEPEIPAWQGQLRAILGEQAFQVHRPNPFLPAADAHVAASPGTMQMPWVGWLAEKVIQDQGKKHARAQGRLARALGERDEPVLPADAVEWSTSLDLPGKSSRAT